MEITCKICGDDLDRVTYAIPWGDDVEFDWQDEHALTFWCEANPRVLRGRVYKIERLTVHDLPGASE